MLESGLSEIIPLLCTSAISGRYPVFTPWGPLGSPEGVTVVWGLIEGRYSSPSQVPSGSLAHTGGLQLLMTVTSLVIDTTGTTPFLSPCLEDLEEHPEGYNMVLNEWVSQCVSTGSGVCTTSIHMRLSGGVTATFIAIVGLPKGHLFLRRSSNNHALNWTGSLPQIPT